jgi:hypothetical protein
MRLGSRNEITIIELVSKPVNELNNVLADEDEIESELEKIMFEPSVINDAEVISLKRGSKSLKNNKDDMQQVKAVKKNNAKKKRRKAQSKSDKIK